MEATGRIVTVSERKEAERARRAAAVVVLRTRLAEYASRHGGRFLLYGSAARGTMRHDSDADVLVDFPPGLRAQAWEFVEDLSRDLRLPIDLNDLQACGPAFLAHIQAVSIA